MTVNPIPEGHHTITPYLIVAGAASAIEFYKSAFGATELFRMDGPDGRVGHAEVQIGDSRVMLTDESPQMNARGPATLGGTPVMLHLYVPDADALFAQAVAAGATVIRPVQNQFYGDRSGGVVDPFGHIWWLSTHVEDVPIDELQRRAAMAKQPKPPE